MLPHTVSTGKHGYNFLLPRTWWPRIDACTTRLVAVVWAIWQLHVHCRVVPAVILAKVGGQLLLTGGVDERSAGEYIGLTDLQFDAAQSIVYGSLEYGDWLD